MTGTWVNKHHVDRNSAILKNKINTIFELIKEEKPDSNLYAYTGWDTLYTNFLEDRKEIINKIEFTKLD